MPACVHCGDMLTDAEWEVGNCPICKQPARWRRGPHGTDYLGAPKPVYARDRDRPDWGTVRTGLGLMIVGVCLFWVSGFFGSFSDVAENAVNGQFAFAATAAARMGSLSAVVLFVAGVCCCAKLPEWSAGRIWVFMAIALQLLVFLFALDVVSMQRDNELTEDRGFTLTYDHLGRIQQKKTKELPHDERQIAIRSTTVVVFATAAHLLLLLFPWSMARYCYRRITAWSALGLLFAGIAFDLVLLSLVWSGPAMEERVTALLYLLLFGPIVLSAWYVINLLSIRRAVTRLIRGESLEPG